MGKGFLSPFNLRAINFDNITARGVWVGYRNYYRAFGRSVSLHVGMEYNHRQENGGPVLSEGFGAYYRLWVPPLNLRGSGRVAYYGYLKYIYHYDEEYGIEDFTAKYAEIGLPGYYVSEWKSITLSVGFGQYLGHPMRSYTFNLQVSPFGANTGIVAYYYRTVLDDLRMLQYYGEVPLPFGLIAKPYLNYTRDEMWGYSYLEGNLILLWEPRPLTGVYLAINKKLKGEKPEDLHHLYEKEVFKVQVRWRVW
jgi:hypothetical protein